MEINKNIRDFFDVLIFLTNNYLYLFHNFFFLFQYKPQKAEQSLYFKLVEFLEFMKIWFLPLQTFVIRLKYIPNLFFQKNIPLIILQNLFIKWNELFTPIVPMLDTLNSQLHRISDPLGSVQVVETL